MAGNMTTVKKVTTQPAMLEVSGIKTAVKSMANLGYFKNRKAEIRETIPTQRPIMGKLGTFFPVDSRVVCLGAIEGLKIWEISRVFRDLGLDF